MGNRRRKARSLRELRFSALRVVVVLDPKHSEMDLLPIFLLLQTVSTTERCSVGGDNNPDNLQNLYIVSCDADGFHIIVEERCRANDFPRIDFGGSVFISVNQWADSSDLPSRPDNSSAGVCTPSSSNRTYERYQDERVMNELCWTLDFGFDECGNAEFNVTSDGDYEYTVYLTEVATDTAQNENLRYSDVFIGQTKISCIVPQLLSISGPFEVAPIASLPSAQSDLDVDNGISLEISASGSEEMAALGEIMELSLNVNEKPEDLLRLVEFLYEFPF